MIFIDKDDIRFFYNVLLTVAKYFPSIKKNKTYIFFVDMFYDLVDSCKVGAYIISDTNNSCVKDIQQYNSIIQNQ